MAPPATPTIYAGIHLASTPYSGSATHTASQWQIDTAAEDFSTPVWDSGTDASNLTSYPDAGAGSLSFDTNYKARVRHQDVNGWSDWSAATTFNTYATGTGGSPFRGPF